MPDEDCHPSWPGLYVAVKLKSEHPRTHLEPPSWAADIEWIRLESLQAANGKEETIFESFTVRLCPNWSLLFPFSLLHKFESIKDLDL